MSAWHPHQGGDPHVALKEARWVIEEHIRTQPRSLQTTIGPSEIGTECDHCLAAKIAGWPQNDSVDWLPFIGTAVHARLDHIFTELGASTNAVHNGGLRWVAEMRLLVGTIGGVEVWGSNDLVDFITGLIVDWKVVGKTTLDDVRRHGPSTVYRVQQHLYAKGWNDAGRRIDHVAIAYLPRNAVSLDHAHWWTEPYDQQIALDALDRANYYATQISALTSISAEVRDAWITALPRHPRCYDCPRFADRPGTITASGEPHVQEIAAPQTPLTGFAG